MGLTYYFRLMDGYDIGDEITIGIHTYEIVEIDQAHQLMTLEEIGDLED